MKKNKSYLFKGIILLFVALLSEILLFNFRHWQSLFNESYVAPMTLGDGYMINDDSSYTANEGSYDIILPKLEGKLKTVYIGIYDVRATLYNGLPPVNVTLYAKDESHHEWYRLGTRDLYSQEVRSFYMPIHLYGDVKELKVVPALEKDQSFYVQIVLNPVIPFRFYAERFTFVYILLIFIMLFSQKSILYDIYYLDLGNRTVSIMLVVFFVINALFFYYEVRLNSYYSDEVDPNTKQYQELAEAFSEGSLSLLVEPSDSLKSMDNPYDMAYRSMVVKWGDYLFDHAYYNGKYYVYFGVVPAALIYFPYYVITGHHIHNYIVCYIGLLFILAGMIMLIDKIIRRHFKRCSVGVWFLTIELFLLGSYVVYIAKRPDLYSIPIVYAIVFALWGMWFFLNALPEEGGKGGMKTGALAVGALLTALIAGCRPQLFLVIIPDLIIIRKYLFTKKIIMSREGHLSIAALVLPMAFIGSLLMLYNAKRFGSPFDFGAFYNLTFNDMRNRGFDLDRLPFGLSIFFLYPPKVVSNYPYISGVFADSAYLGETIQETTYGGILFSAPFGLLGLMNFFYGGELKKMKTLYLLSVSLICVALVVASFDVINSGVLARYFFDFSFLLMLSSVLTVYNILSGDYPDKRIIHFLIRLLVFVTVYEIIYQLLVFMLDSGEYLMNSCRNLYAHLSYMIGFGQ